MWQRPTIAKIDLSAIKHNFAVIRGITAPSAKTLAVVKADAYGHGAVPVSNVLAASGVDWLGVAIPEEGVQLREAGNFLPILSLGGIYNGGNVGAYEQYKITPVIFEPEIIKVIKPSKPPLAVHLKVDTGMGRLGATEDTLDECLEALKANKALRLEGVFSHFANADLADREFSAEQLKRFERMVAKIQGYGFAPSVFHLANSAATLAFIPAHKTMVRPGIAIYGFVPSNRLQTSAPLRPAFSMVTRIHQLKKVPPGTGISYGHRFITKRESMIATLPVGYADGYPRLLTNRGQVLIRGKRAPIVGAVCMDLTMVDVTDIPGAARGDEVVLIGKRDGAEITVTEVAEWAETIHYDIICGIGKRVPRVWLSDEP